MFDWPADGNLYLPGLKTDIQKARLLSQTGSQEIRFEKLHGWVKFELPLRAPEKLASVVEVTLGKAAQADPTWGLDPNLETTVLVEFATVDGAVCDSVRWMEKFGEWKHAQRVHQWEPGGKATWEVDVLVPGVYDVGLTYSGEGRLVWSVAIENGERIQNQQNSSHNYQQFPIGWVNFPKSGRYQVSASCVEGDLETASLESIHFKRVEME